MKTQHILFLFTLSATLLGCQITETININPDGSGTIETMGLRDEQSYMQLAGENYTLEEKFVDTTYFFSEYITKYAENYSKLPVSEKEIYNKFKNVKVHIEKSSFEKKFQTTISQAFDKIEEAADLYKTEEYADDLENNYALTAEEHYYSVNYAYDGSVFKRIVKITAAVELKKQQDKIEGLKTQFSKFKITQPYLLKYHFPRKIKSVSNTQAKISEDKKSLELQFLITDCLQNPESTNLEVILE